MLGSRQTSPHLPLSEGLPAAVLHRGFTDDNPDYHHMFFSLWSVMSSRNAVMFSSFPPGQNSRCFTDDIMKCIFLNEKVWIFIKFSLKFVPKDPINNIPTLVQIMAWRRPGDKPLSEPMMVSLPRQVCLTWPQWVNVGGITVPEA